MTLSLEELGFASDVLVWQAALLTIVSFAVGVLGGLVGLALGTMRLPALLMIGIAAPTAAGTNILVSSLSASAGAVRHFRERRVDLRTVVLMGAPSFAGAFVGGFGTDRVPHSVLFLLAGLLVFWQGVEFIARGRAPSAAGRGDGDIHRASHVEGTAILSPNRALVGGAVGLAVGLLGGAVGLILGSIRLPALIRILRLDPETAAGTNLFIGSIMGTVAWVGHVLQGQVDYPLLVLMGGAAMLGSYHGARLTGRVGLNTLITTMGWVLLVVGALLVWQAFGDSIG
jgi:uncharacterized membrane protein YfcA